MKKLALLIAVFLATACAAVAGTPRPVERPQALAVINSVCNTYHMPCVENADPDATPYVKDGVVSISPGWCAKDIDLCEFAMHHEAWHVIGGDNRKNERIADCFAVSGAPLQASHAALEWFAGRHPLQYDDAHGLGAQRAAIVLGCVGPGSGLHR